MSPQWNEPVASRHPKRLGINIDHVATLRNARGGVSPCPVAAAETVIRAGADGIVAHLREDRRHIRDDDIWRLKREIDAPLNFEIAPTAQMVAIAKDVRPFGVCFVPERREELTTEGGLDLTANPDTVSEYVRALQHLGVRVSVFIAPERESVSLAAQMKVDAVELHTGQYANAKTKNDMSREQQYLAHAAHEAACLGLEVHVGHGLTTANLPAIAAIAPAQEFNIGHAVIALAVQCGLHDAVCAFRNVLSRPRSSVR